MIHKNYISTIHILNSLNIHFLTKIKKQLIIAKFLYIFSKINKLKIT